MTRCREVLCPVVMPPYPTPPRRRCVSEVCAVRRLQLSSARFALNHLLLFLLFLLHRRCCSDFNEPPKRDWSPDANVPCKTLIKTRPAKVPLLQRATSSSPSNSALKDVRARLQIRAPLPSRGFPRRAQRGAPRKEPSRGRGGSWANTGHDFTRTPSKRCRVGAAKRRQPISISLVTT